MLTQTSKRFLALLLAVVMLFSVLPMQAFATEMEESQEPVAQVSDESDELIQLRGEIDQYIETFGLSTDMSNAELKDLYLGLDDEQRMLAKNEAERIRYYGTLLPEAEQKVLLKEQNTKLGLRFYDAILSTYGPVMMAAVEEYSKTIDGVISVDVEKNSDLGTCVTDDADGPIVVTVTGAVDDSGCEDEDVSATAIVYVKNVSGKKGTITFNWVAANVAMETSLTETSHSVLLAAGDTFEIKIKSPAGPNGTGTLTLSDFTFAELQGNNNITFGYESDLGAVTVGGEAVADGDVVAVPLSGTTLVATPTSGNKFIAWVNGENKPISWDATYVFAPETPMTVKAIFASTADPTYLVDKTYVLKGWDEAFEKGNLAVLLNDATLPAGDYTVPAGKTLLIPFDASNTLCTTVPAYSSGEITPSAYRTLTMAEGAKLTVEGAMSISGSQVAGGANAGIPKSTLGFVKMASNSNITVANGGNLYVWGYIMGAGTVTVKNGGTVYEDFQVTCWRGGTNITSMLKNKYRVFPMSQYYIQNVEVPMTLEAGAVENGYMSVTVAGSSVGAEVPFVGPNGMFNVTSGSITKDYNEANDRLEIDVNGAVAMQSLSLSLRGVGTIDSSAYELPVNSNITVRVNAGSNISITQNLAMLPGTELYVAKDANVALGSGTSIFFYDASEWTGKGYAYASSDVRALSYAPGRTGAKHTADNDAYLYVEGTLDASAGYVYTTESGANITAAEGAKVIVKPGTQTVTYQVTQTGSDGKTLLYTPAITITPAKLKNADGTYSETSVLPYAEYTYTDGVWGGKCLHVYKDDVTTAANCTVDGVKTFSCACGFSYTEAIPATGHDYKDTVTDPTCTEDGYTTHTCAKCSDSYTDTPTTATGHDYNAVVTDPTCDKAGFTTHTCAKCSDSYTDTPTEATGHNYEAVVTAPTCTVDGFTTHTCTKCSDSYTDATVAAGGHTEATVPGKDATCKETGLTAGVKCSACGETLTAQEEIPVIPHTEETVPGKDATCKEPGLTAGVKCSACGDTLTAQEEIPVLAHTWDDGIVTTQPTVETEGVKTYTCSACGETKTESIPKLHVHTEETVPGKDATCTKDGLTDGVKCSSCGEIIVAQEVIPAKNHTEETVPGKDATCKEPGLTDGKKCSVCGETITAQEEIPTIAHTEETIPGKDATCKETGLTAGVKCSVCGETLTAQEEIPAKGHTEETVPGKEATCTEAGLTDGVKCSACGETITAQEEIPASGHTEETVPGKTATCTETGLTDGVKCSACGETITAQEEIPAKGHTEETVPGKDAACTEDGLTAGVKCSICGDTVTAQEVIPAKGHGELVEEELIPALCEEDGHEEGKKCTDCGEYVEGGALLPATGHKLYQYAAKIPTYTLPGYDAYEKCSQCAYTTYEEIPKVETPHIKDYESFIKNLTILEEAAHQYALANPGTDPLNLIIKYIRTGVERYNSGSWNIMAGYEDAGFRKFADEEEDKYNQKLPREQWVAMSSLKYIDEFQLPNGDIVDFGHMFGTMDITYHNNCGVDHADVGGWSGDLVDLLTTSSRYIGENYSADLETTVSYIQENYLFKMVNVDDKFSATDWYGDADGFYIMQKITKDEYKNGDLVALMNSYFTASLDDFDRADYLIQNRFSGVSTRQDLRNAVYNAYTGNKTISTLESTRDFEHSGEELTLLRRAVCYAFADYLCETAGDYVDVTENPYYEVFDSKSADLAPGITQQLNYATSADGKQMAYYIATADLRNPQVHVYANYASRDPQEWAMARVLDQANNMQELYGNPESEEYIENFNVIASINAGGYDMSDGDPGGLLVMHGDMYKPISSGGFFAITKEGKAVLGATSEWDQYADQVEEAIGGFGTLLVKDGQIAITATSNYYSDRAPRSAVGITATGKVVFMVLDGRQEPFSCGGSMIEIAQIMYEAGCVNAINLDGGGSSTFVAKQPGDENLSVMNRPSDGAPRSVSTSLVMASTAPSSTAFDHANLLSEAKYVTKGASMQITAEGISATGNAAELPEGITWVIDSASANWASIDENGLFTAKDRTGSVEVKLMVGDKVVGQTTIGIVEPDQLYFTKTTLSAVYGQTIQLPVKALYKGKAVAMRAEDITFTMNAEAGIIDGFGFTAKESAIKNVRIVAALANNADINATVTINLYKQGENSFDFDQATSGDRMLAWLRTVSNATTDDDVTYTVLDAQKDMVTSYVLAMDMSQIPVPDILDELIYMLPGADLEDASAWGFLMQLAERVSPMTTVTPKIVFDSRMDVDISEMKLLNEYFTITGQEFDEATNTLTLKLNWIDQTAAIDPATANPLCMVTGIKVTPKADADWGTKDTLNIVHSGDISYDIYLRASGLYSFAQKPENQQTFGLYDYVNPNDSADRGGHFMSTYAKFEDSYTLVNVAKDGWVNEAGGFAYYVDGQRLTGIQEIDGVYYDFGETGINVGQTKYNGLYFDADMSVYRYVYLGKLASGWQSIDGEWYYFRSSTMAAATGFVKMYGVTYEFETNGRLVSGVWANTLKGVRYYYGPSYYDYKWLEVDGEMYYFKDGYRLTGIQQVRAQDNSGQKKWYNFGEDGICREIEDGLIVINGELYYMIDGVHQVGLQKVNGDYYFFTYAGPAVVGQTYYAWETHCDLPCSNYAFGLDGKMVNGLAEMSDGYYYYVNGKVATSAAGLTKIGDDYYFVSAKGKVATGEYYCWATNCDLPCSTYEFGADGKMLQGIVTKEDGAYYYINGKLGGKNAGLTKVGEDYYFVASNGRCATGSYYAWATNCDLPCSTYEFGADGKMLQGIVTKEDGTYYYINGKLAGKNAGLTKVGDDYYFVSAKGKVATGEYYCWATNCDLPCSTYEFGADGKMLQGIVTKEDGIYYYINGKLGGKNAGLTKVGEDYYFVASNGRCATGSYYAWATNCDLPCSTYEFGPDGKMLHGIVEKEDGIYCYVYGKMGGNAGLIKIGEDYYFVASNGKCATGKYNCWATKCDLPTGTYEFGPDGKMYDGFVTKSDGIYYYENGKIGKVGLNYIDGYYYFVTSKGKLVVNQTYYVWETNGLLLEQDYVFNELGQIVG